jgi:hypothetical protein
MSMQIVPIEFDEACQFVKTHHRHHRPPVGHKFSLAVAVDDQIVGVAIVGRPVSRLLDNGWTLEVTRLCTNGHPNACSKLYAACWKVAKNLGYQQLITYTLRSESGVSLRAAGWKCLGLAGGGSWNTVSRPRVDKAPTQLKLKYCAA